MVGEARQRRGSEIRFVFAAILGSEFLNQTTLER
jgi:hypothetical protein